MPHIHEKIDFTVEVFVLHEHKVLLRKHDKFKIWLSVGGHIELDEDPNQAAIEEVKEEVGLDIELIGEQRSFVGDTDHPGNYKELIPPRFINRHRYGTNPHEHVTMVYFARAKHTNIKQIENHEKSEDIRWFTLAELDDPQYALRDNIKFYAKKTLEQA